MLDDAASRLRRWMCGFATDEKGAVAIEYGLICALVFLVIVGAMQTVADGLMSNFWNPVAAAFAQ